MTNKGFSLLEVLVSLVIGSMLSLSAATLLGLTAKSKSDSMELANIATVRQLILKTLGNSAAWSRTIQMNASMACLLPDALAPCPPNVPLPFTLRDAAGNEVADSVNPGSGFTSQGSACNPRTFTAAGNDDCPFRYQLQWSAVCDAAQGPCTSPQVLVNARLLYAPRATNPQKLTINPQRFSIHDFYINNTGSMCLANVQQVFLYNTTPGAPLVTNFVVPDYKRNIYIEIWGGGGGGTGQNSLVPSPGSDGGATTFDATPFGVTTALGGLGGGNLFAAPSMGCCWSVPICIPIGGGSMNGWPAQNPLNPNLLSGISPNSCSPVNSSSLGGPGGPGAAWIFNPATGGRYGGGGGGAGWLWGDAMTACPIFQLFGVGAGDGWSQFMGGRYNAAVYTPATLPPGTVATVTIGAGGIGGLSGTCVWVGFPFCVFGKAGDGGPGVAKITWE